MRYEVGQKYAFARVEFTPHDRDYGGLLFFPGRAHLERIEVVVLTCMEHHRVSGEWDDEIKYDGFIFLDNDGRRYFNQYPHAAYGQLDDSNDRRVQPDYEQDKWVGVSNPWFHYTDALSMLSNVKRAVHGGERQNIVEKEGYDPEPWIKYLEQLQASIEVAIGRKIFFEELTMKKLDGTTVHLPLYWVAKYVPENPGDMKWVIRSGRSSPEIRHVADSEEAADKWMRERKGIYTANYERV